MAKKKSQQQEAAEEAIRLIEKEAQIRAQMNASYDDYIEAVKKAHALQKTLTQNKEIEKEIQKVINTGKRNGVQLTQDELDIEIEKLKIIQSQNDKIEKQVDLYKKAAKEANVLSMAAGKGFAKLGKTIAGLPDMVKGAWGKIEGLGLFEFDKAIKQSALSMGVLSKESSGFRGNLKAAAKETTMMGVNLKGLAELQSSYSENLGRTVVLSKQGLEGMAAMSKMTGLGAEGTAQMAADMDLQGYSAERTAGFVEETLNASHKMGVNATKVMKNLSGNLKLMNKYHFKEGAKGLAKMAQLVTKLGVDMNSVSGMADKLWNIEGAVEMSAQLNVMGGAWAQMADPFHLMYMARNDMKGLTEEIAKASQESISFNKATGEFDMTAEGMHRLKIIAEQTGIAYEDLVTMGKNMAKFDKIKSQVGFSVGGSEEDKAMLEYISSKSTMDKNGKAEIMINGKPKLLSQLSAADKSVIQSQMNEQESMKKRAEQARSFDEQLTYFIDNLKVTLLPMIESFNKPGGLADKLDLFVKDFNKPGGMGEVVSKFAGVIGDFVSSIGAWMLEHPKLTAGLWAFSKGIPLIVGAFKLLGGLWDMAKWFMNGVALGKGYMSVAGAMGVGGGGGNGGNGGGGGMLSNFLRGGPKGGMGRNILAGLTKKGIMGPAGMFGKFGATKGGMSLMGSLAKGAKLGSPLGLIGMGADIGRGFMDDPNSTGGKLLGNVGTTASWAGTGAMIGSVIPGLGTAAGAIIGGAAGLGKSLYDEWFSGPATEDALFNSPVKDGFFSGSAMKKALLTSMIPAIGPAISASMALNDVMNTRGVVQGGKITPIDNKDDVVALKKGGAIDKFAGGGGTSEVKHTFEPMTINGTIKIEGPGGMEIDRNILENESFKRHIAKIVKDETIKQVSMGKMKG